MTHPEPIVLFDGSCGLCHRSIRFLLRHERTTVLRFAPLDSSYAQTLLAAHSLPADIDAMVLVEKGKAWTGSDAALQLTRYLKPPFSWARILGILPASLHRALYRAVARRRYQWFGSTDRCSLPDPAHSERFLSP